MVPYAIQFIAILIFFMLNLVVSRYILAVIIPLSIFAGTFFLQLNLGADVSLFPLYMLAVAGLSWELGLYGAIGSVVVSTGLWVTSMLKLNEVYSSDYIIYYNAGARTAVFIMVAYFILMFRSVLEQHRRRMESMRALLNVCHGCGSLQGSDGNWIKLEELGAVANRPMNECPCCRSAVTELNKR